ncbi:MAG: GAF domain-containing protein [Chthoniobacteraceae bacterium]
MPAPLPENESQRLAALRRYQILDTSAEQAFDDFAFLASTICQTPIALMTLVDGDRQWFKARVGLEATETPREQAFCAHTILGTDVMVVEDATRDARFSSNPLVTEAPHIRFYAGAPLIDGEGYSLGSLCVIDRHARPLEPEQKKSLQALARQVIAQLELRRASADLAEAASDIKTLRGLLPICSHCKGVRNEAGFWQSVETYVMAHSDAGFSHGICPDCLKQHHPKAYERLHAEGKA